MARWRCVVCGGTYEDFSGAARYYHACPPERAAPGPLPTDPPVKVPILNPRDENTEPDPANELGRPRRDGAGRVLA